MAAAPVNSALPVATVAARVECGESGCADRPSSDAPLQLEPHEQNRLRAMVDSYFDFVWRSLRRLGVPTASVDDEAQRVFWVVARRLGEVDAARERAYLFGVAVRVAADWRRAQLRRREVPGDDEWLSAEHPLPAPDELLDQKRARETLDALLEELPLEMRTVLVLIEGEGLRAHEAAEILGLPEGTVSSRLRRARALLAESVQRWRARSESMRGRRS